MSGFSPEWLALREPVDHRSRNTALARRLAGHFAGRASVSVVDLGCGTGSNLRGLFAGLPAEQRWTLVDYDPGLLAAARRRLAAWGGVTSAGASALEIAKDGKRLTVEFREADLNRDLDRALGGAPDLITAAAFFDLCSATFIADLARAVAARKAAFFTALTYNGIQTWAPPHAADTAMTAAFHAHQRTDKGIGGGSAGPDAPQALARAFRAVGAGIAEGDSPWQLGPADAPLIADLAAGFADAVAETGALPAAEIQAWRRVVRTGAVVGHTDTLALPGDDPRP